MVLAASSYAMLHKESRTPKLATRCRAEGLNTRICSGPSSARYRRSPAASAVRSHSPWPTVSVESVRSAVRAGATGAPGGFTAAALVLVGALALVVADASVLAAARADA